MQPVVPRFRTRLVRFARRIPSWRRTGPPLVRAAATGQVARIEALLAAGEDVDERNERGQTALHVAARCSRIEAAARLLVRGARHDLLDDEGRRPLDASNVDPETLHSIRQTYRRTALLPDDPLISRFGPDDATGESWLARLRRDGIVRIPGLVPEPLLAAMQSDFASFVAEIDRRRALGQADKQAYDEEEHWWAEDLAYVSNNAFKHSPALTRFFCDPRLAALARSYYARPAFLTRGVAMRYLPLEERRTDMFGWHHDLEDRRLKVLILLTDLPETGQVMSYVKGSHVLRHGHRQFFRNRLELADCERRLGRRAEIVETVGRAGDVYLFDSNGVHRGNRRPTAPIRDTFFIEWGIDTSNIWGGDPSRELVESLVGPGLGPFAELLAAPRKWTRPMTRRHPTWIETLHAVDAWRCRGDGLPGNSVAAPSGSGP